MPAETVFGTLDGHYAHPGMPNILSPGSFYENRAADIYDLLHGFTLMFSLLSSKVLEHMITAVPQALTPYFQLSNKPETHIWLQWREDSVL
jgi:hypothetical protein